MLEKKFDIDNISQKTHISVLNIDYLFNLEFDKLNALKTNSFIAIIEREMELDLSEIKEASQAYYKTKKSPASVLIKEYSSVEEKDNKMKYLIALILLSSVSYGIFLISDNVLNTNNTTDIIPSSAIVEPIVKVEDTKEEIKEQIIEQEIKTIEPETNINQSINPSVPLEIEEKDETTDTQEEVIEEVKEVKEIEVVEEPIAVIEKSIKVISKQKVWIGITYLDNLKSVNFTKKEFEFDPNRDFVAVFGHNYIKILTHDNEYDYKKEQNKRRISYIDGKVSIISKKKLKSIIKEQKLNR